jgi:hypothetical protein
MNDRRLHRMCEAWGMAKAALEFGDQPAPASIFGRIQDYGAGAPATRGEIRNEYEVLTGDALDVNCAIWFALTLRLPRGRRLTEKQYRALFAYYVPVEGADGRLMTLLDKARCMGIAKGTLTCGAAQARSRIAPFIGKDARQNAARRILYLTTVQDGC